MGGALMRIDEKLKRASEALWEKAAKALAFKGFA